MIVLITILVKILENEVVVSVRVFLESNQTLIRHINISFTSISHSHQYLIHINISFTSISHSHQYLIHINISFTSISHSHQYLIHINISFTSISHSHQYLIHINISFTHIAERGSVRDRAMVFNATFNNISVISWRAVLLVKKTLIIL